MAYSDLPRRLPPIQQWFDKSDKAMTITPDPGYTIPNPTGWSNEKSSSPCRYPRNHSDDTQSASVATTSARSKTASATQSTVSASAPLHGIAAQKDIHRNELQPKAEDQNKRQSHTDEDRKAEEKRKKQTKHAGNERTRREGQKRQTDQLESLLSKELGYKLELGTKNKPDKLKVLERSVNAVQELKALLTALWLLMPELTRFQKQCQTSDSASPASSSPLERVLAIVNRHPNARARSSQSDLKSLAGNLPSPVSLHGAGSPFAP